MAPVSQRPLHDSRVRPPDAYPWTLARRPRHAPLHEKMSARESTDRLPRARNLPRGIPYARSPLLCAALWAATGRPLAADIRVQCLLRRNECEIPGDLPALEPQCRLKVISTGAYKAVLATLPVRLPLARSGHRARSPIRRLKSSTSSHAALGARAKYWEDNFGPTSVVARRCGRQWHLRIMSNCFNRRVVNSRVRAAKVPLPCHGDVGRLDGSGAQGRHAPRHRTLWRLTHGHRFARWRGR